MTDIVKVTDTTTCGQLAELLARLVISARRVASSPSLYERAHERINAMLDDYEQRATGSLR